MHLRSYSHKPLPRFSALPQPPACSIFTPMGNPRLFLCLFCLAYLPACTENPTPDVHPEVFKTTGQVAHDRKAQYQQVWQDTALSILKSDRPDIDAKPLGENKFGVILQADGVRREVDLSPESRTLATQTGQTDTLLRHALRPILQDFDQQRLLALDFGRFKSQITPLLLGQVELRQRSADMQLPGLLPANPITDELSWIPVIQWSPSIDSVCPITPQVLEKWQITPAQIDQAAMDNLKASFRPDFFITTQFELLGKVGTIKPEFNPAIILLPEFLQSIRKAWNISGDLALLPANRRNIRFADASDTRLLNMIYPDWERTTQDTPEPLATKVLLAGNDGITVMRYDPPIRLHIAASQPANARPGVSRPGMVRPGMERPDPLKNLIYRGPTTRPIPGR
jgi:hypothetical protein